MTYVMGKKELLKVDHLYLMNLLVNCFISFTFKFSI